LNGARDTSRRFAGALAWAEVARTPATIVAVDGMVAGQRYRFRVVPSNAAGDGMASDELDVQM
jgi:hypothetical protein